MYYIGIFISHSWKYTEHFERLSDWIFVREWNVGGVPLRFIDYSIPKNDPIHNARNEADLRTKIFVEIQKSDVLVCPTGMYASYSKWIEKELSGARELGVSVLAVNPWAQERKSSVVSDRADATVGWTSEGVVRGIWNLRRRR